MPFRIAYVVSGEGRLLQATLNARELGLLPVQVSCVIGGRPCLALERAKKAGIPTKLVSRKDYPERSRFDDDLSRAIIEADVDGIVLNFDFLLRGPVVDHYRGRALNTHFALLPLFPGFRAVEQAKAAGVRFAGITVHLVDSGMDSGPIVSQAVVPVDPVGRAEDLGRELFHAAVRLQLQAIAFLANGRIQMATQRDVLVKEALYRPGTFSPSLESPFSDLPAGVMKDVL